MNCREAVYSEDVAEYFVQRFQGLASLQKQYGADCIQALDERYAVVYIQSAALINFNNEFSKVYRAVPKCYTVTDQFDSNSQVSDRNSAAALEEIGVAQLRRLPYLDLYGNGVMIGFVDTGIDYTHPSFRNSDGTSRIYSIWDQTVQDGVSPAGFTYGQEYTKLELNQALSSEEPLSLLPETDEIGHGTFVAGVAAGNIERSTDFSGVAPQTEIVMVKLKQAKEYLRDLYVIPQGKPCFQETDLIFGVQYLIRTAEKANKPLVICMTLNTNSGGHDGAGILDEILDDIGDRHNTCIVTSTGNEGGYGLHYHSNGVRSNGYEEVELRVGEGENGFTMELWATSLNQYSISVISPTGELINREMNRRNHTQIMDFLFEDTKIFLDYYMAESASGTQLILMRVQRPTSGIWRFLVYQDQEFGGAFDMWLPVHTFLQETTYFLRPDPDTTIANPGNTVRIITAASYQISDQSIYLHSGRGFTRNNLVKPDIAAPGVAIYGPRTGGGYRIVSGGGAAAALTAGGCVLLLEWAIVMKRQPEMRTQNVKRLLRGGAEREGVTYPSREWGDYVIIVSSS